jgi:hypothetical protein
VAQPAVTSRTQAAASAAARCHCAVTTGVTRSMAVTPSGGSASRARKSQASASLPTARAVRVWAGKAERHLTADLTSLR